MNKLERYTVYCILLQEAEDLNNIPHLTNYFLRQEGICFLLSYVFNLHCYSWPPSLKEKTVFSIAKQLPELYALKPQKKLFDEYWWTPNEYGWKKRIQILKECIKQTHP
jgi:hypothetical protein